MMSFLPQMSPFWRLIKLSVIICLFYAPTVCATETSPNTAVETDFWGLNGLPSEYGEIIFQKNARHPRQIYIIGQSHRSAASGQDAGDTVRVQTEIYRIGEWLARKAKVELLLPEGYFRKTSPGAVPLGPPQPLAERIDNEALVAQLSNTRRFVNADMLLNLHCNLRLGQVENERLYEEVRHLLSQASDEPNDSVYPQLVSTQERRTAAMLSNIPQAVEKALEDGNICSPQAIFTIGLAHLREIIDFLKKGSPNNPSAETELLASENNLTGLERLEAGYGVTVILPRSLAQNKELLRLTELQTL